jgi:biopolymer transport protein TolQ
LGRGAPAFRFERQQRVGGEGVQHAALAVWALMAQNATILKLVGDSTLFAKLILLLLIVLSVLSWGVAIDKLLLYRRIERQARAIRLEVRAMRNVHELLGLLEHGYSGPLMGILRESRRVLQRMGEDVSGREFLLADFQRASQKAIIDALAQLEKNLVVLSTTTTVSPFLGLLGTCWGIMISFINIGAKGSANLGVVAPGIAEALIATIAGLATAIPALVFYNMLTNRVRMLENEMESFAITVVDFLEREVRSQKVPR